MKLKTNGCILAIVGFGLVSSALGCHHAAPPAEAPPPPPAAPPPPAPMKGAQLDISGEIEFDVGQASIKDSPGSQSVLNAVLTALQASPSITKVRVEGHTDGDGNPANNLALSEQRANAVVTWLTGKGINTKRLHSVGCGSKDPIVPNTTPENKAKNRRTEFDVEEVDGKKPDGFTEACAPNPAVTPAK